MPADCCHIITASCFLIQIQSPQDLRRGTSALGGWSSLVCVFIPVPKEWTQKINRSHLECSPCVMTDLFILISAQAPAESSDVQSLHTKLVMRLIIKIC